jgi:protein TonB
MNHRAGLLFPAALGISAAAHLLMLFLWPYSPVRPAQLPPEPIAVRLLQTPRPASLPLADARRQTVRPEQRIPAAEPVPPPQQPEPTPQPAAETPLELASPAPEVAFSPQTDEEGAPAAFGTDASASLAGEIAATQAVLASLRTRIVEKIRYPALARANGWKGTVLLELLLDERGLLQGLAVRRSSGYTVLDRAAAALMRSVTPVENPLGRPLRIEVPIAYELKD